jgi:hypothetical protein
MMGRSRQTLAWPTRIFNVHVLMFFLWGHVESSVYAVAVTDVPKLQQRVEDGCELI